MPSDLAERLREVVAMSDRLREVSRRGEVDALIEQESLCRGAIEAVVEELKTVDATTEGERESIRLALRHAQSVYAEVEDALRRARDEIGRELQKYKTGRKARRAYEDNL
ncbi:MAG: flagellar protein FliT [Chromatiales bacterium]|nr:flagellar protein FliT [Chromatiales bacterium]MDX9766125.1 flagellar protein FliT [Ectothiorhodospiraceae bacterium]